MPGSLSSIDEAISEPLGLRTGAERVDRFLDERNKAEGLWLEIELAGRDFGEVETSSISESSVSPDVCTAFA